MCVVSLGSSAQTASSTRHTVGGGDTLYGIVAQYYPERMARWTDVAVDIVALNPDAFPQGLDTVMKLNDELILVDYGQPLGDSLPASSTATDSSGVPAAAEVRPEGSSSEPDANPDTSIRPTAAQTSERSGQSDVAPSARDNATVPSTPSDNRQSTDLANTDVSGEAIGQVVSVNQRAVAIDHANQQRPLAVSDHIYPGDAITTAENSRVSIRMLDNAEIHLQPTSRLMLERYQYNPDTQRGNAVLTLVKGGFGTTSGLLGTHQPDAVTVNTAVATVGIRGTQFALRVCAPDTCRRNDSRTLDPGLYTGVLEGAIVISNNTGDLVSSQGEFFHVAAPNTLPEATQDAATLLFSAEQLAQFNVKVEEEKPLSFLGWLKRKLFGD